MIAMFGQARWRVAGAALVILTAGLIWWKSGTPNPANSEQSPPPSLSPTPAKAPRRDVPRNLTPRQPRLADLPVLPAPEAPPHPPGSPENDPWIQQRIDALDALAWEDDPESLRKILAELRGPLPEIRAAALKATLDFDDPAAIPFLRAISRDTVDPLEQRAIDELIETLELPSLIETLEESDRQQ